MGLSNLKSLFRGRTTGTFQDNRFKEDVIMDNTLLVGSPDFQTPYDIWFYKRANIVQKIEGNILNGSASTQYHNDSSEIFEIGIQHDGGSGDRFFLFQSSNDINVLEYNGTTLQVVKDINVKASADQKVTFLNLENTGGFAGGAPAITWENSSGSLDHAEIRSEPGSAFTNSKLFISVADSSKVLQERIVTDVNGFTGFKTSSPVATVDINGGIALNVVSKTTTYTATTSDFLIKCDASGGDFTVTLPASAGVSGLILNIKNTVSGVVTVDGNASETIDGSTTVTVNNPSNLQIISDGSNWIVI